MEIWYVFINPVFTKYLQIIPRARMGSESIAHSAFGNFYASRNFFIFEL